MVLGAFVTYVSRSSCAAQPRTSRPFLRAGADFGGVSSWSAVLGWVRRYWAPRTCMCVCCRCTHSCYYNHTQIVLTPPKAGQVPATRRSEATPRPRAGCPPASAAGLIMTPKRDARGQHELSARAFCPRAACQPGCSAWHRQLARRRSQARLLGWLVPAVHEAATG